MVWFYVTFTVEVCCIEVAGSSCASAVKMFLVCKPASDALQMQMFVSQKLWYWLVVGEGSCSTTVVTIVKYKQNADSFVDAWILELA